MTRRLLSAAVFLIAASTALADPPRGYWVQSSGYYDRYPYPPAYGGRMEYSAGRPIVHVQDQSGAVVPMRLQPKVLYYSTPLVTPEGYYYPTSISVIPDDRRPIVREPVPPTQLGPPYQYDGGPRSPIPPVSSGNHNKPAFARIVRP